MARPGIEPRTSGLRVRCPTDYATRPGVCIVNEYLSIYINRPVALLSNNNDVRFINVRIGAQRRKAAVV